MAKTTRIVTEQDLRKDEFKNMDVDDLEFREDGAIVRKDRWICGISNIACIVGYARKKYEISDIVNAVRDLTCKDWPFFENEQPESDTIISILLNDGCVLKHAKYNKELGFFTWRDTCISSEEVLRWK